MIDFEEDKIPTDIEDLLIEGRKSRSNSIFSIVDDSFKENIKIQNFKQQAEVKVFVGSTKPAHSIGGHGDIYFRTGEFIETYRKVEFEWLIVENIKRNKKIKDRKYILKQTDINYHNLIDIDLPGVIIIPHDGDEDFPVGSILSFTQRGEGKIKIISDYMVTLNFVNKKDTSIGKNCKFHLRKVGINEWDVWGQIDSSFINKIKIFLSKLFI